MTLHIEGMISYFFKGINPIVNIIASPKFKLPNCNVAVQHLLANKLQGLPHDLSGKG